MISCSLRGATDALRGQTPRQRDGPRLEHEVTSTAEGINGIAVDLAP